MGYVSVSELVVTTVIYVVQTHIDEAGSQSFFSCQPDLARERKVWGMAPAL